MEGTLRTIKEYRSKYMQLYTQGQALFAEYNPCEPHADGSCMRTRLDPSYERVKGDRCCSSCKFHTTSDGCHTIALSCKLWVCSKITNMAFDGNHPRLREFHDKLQDLKIAMGELRPYPGCRESMHESLNILRERIVKYILLERRRKEDEAAEQRGQEETQTPRYQEVRS